MKELGKIFIILPEKFLFSLGSEPEGHAHLCHVLIVYVT